MKVGLFVASENVHKQTDTHTTFMFYKYRYGAANNGHPYLHSSHSRLHLNHSHLLQSVHAFKKSQPSSNIAEKEIDNSIIECVFACGRITNFETLNYSFHVERESESLILICLICETGHYIYGRCRK